MVEPPAASALVDQAVERLLLHGQRSEQVLQLLQLRAENQQLKSELKAVQQIDDAEIERLWGTVEELEVKLSLAQQRHKTLSQQLPVQANHGGAQAAACPCDPQQQVQAHDSAGGQQLTIEGGGDEALPQLQGKQHSEGVLAKSGPAPALHSGAAAAAAAVHGGPASAGASVSAQADLRAQIDSCIRRQLQEVVGPQLRAQIRGALKPLTLAQGRQLQPLGEVAGTEVQRAQHASQSAGQTPRPEGACQPLPPAQQRQRQQPAAAVLAGAGSAAGTEALQATEQAARGADLGDPHPSCSIQPVPVVALEPAKAKTQAGQLAQHAQQQGARPSREQHQQKGTAPQQHAAAAAGAVKPASMAGAPKAAVLARRILRAPAVHEDEGPPAAAAATAAQGRSIQSSPSPRSSSPSMEDMEEGELGLAEAQWATVHTESLPAAGPRGVSPQGGDVRRGRVVAGVSKKQQAQQQQDERKMEQQKKKHAQQQQQPRQSAMAQQPAAAARSEQPRAKNPRLGAAAAGHGLEPPQGNMAASPPSHGRQARQPELVQGQQVEEQAWEEQQEAEAGPKLFAGALPGLPGMPVWPLGGLDGLGGMGAGMGPALGGWPAPFGGFMVPLEQQLMQSSLLGPFGVGGMMAQLGFPAVQPLVNPLLGLQMGEGFQLGQEPALLQAAQHAAQQQQRRRQKKERQRRQQQQQQQQQGRGP